MTGPLLSIPAAALQSGVSGSGQSYQRIEWISADPAGEEYTVVLTSACMDIYESDLKPDVLYYLGILLNTEPEAEPEAQTLPPQAQRASERGRLMREAGRKFQGWRRGRSDERKRFGR